MIVNYIFIFITVILMIVGLVDLCKMVILWILRTKEEDEFMIVVPISGHNEEAEFLLRSAAAKVLFTDTLKTTEVICLDCGMDDETRKICETIVDGYSFMKMENVLTFNENLNDSN